MEQNKWEHISERELEFVLDHLNTLNELTLKIRCKERNGVDPMLIFGLESMLFLDSQQGTGVHHDEVETISLYRGPGTGCRRHCRNMEHEHPGGDIHGDFCYGRDEIEEDGIIDEEALASALKALSKDVIWRVKGYVRLGRGVHIVNWAFGRYELTAVGELHEHEVVKLTVMGERGAVKSGVHQLGKVLAAEVTCCLV